MDVTEYDLVAIGVNKVVQRIGLPLAEHFPCRDHDLVDDIQLFAAEGWVWWYMSTIFYNLLIKASWVEKVIVGDIKRFTHPEMHLVTVFRQRGQKHVAIAQYFLIFKYKFIDNIRGVFANFQNNDRFWIFLAVIVSNAVVFSFFILQDQAWTTNHTVRCNNIEFLSAFWSVYPAFGFLDWGVAKVDRHVFDAVFTIALLEDDVAHAHGIAAKDAICIEYVVGFRYVFNDAACTSIVGSTWLIKHFGETGGCVGHLFHFDLGNARVWCCWLGPIDNMEILAVTGWRPGAARPVPYEGLHAGFCGNVPQWFCVAETAVEVVTGGIQMFWILTPEAGDAVGDRQCAGSQRRPQWGSDRWRGAE